MSKIATTLSVSVVGIHGHIVEVETHVTSGLVNFILVGLPDTSMKEAKDRVRSAIHACTGPFPDARLTVNLCPAGIPKSGSMCDAAIALSVLIATGALPAARYYDCVVLAELGLDGTMRPVRGILPAVIAAQQRGIGRVIVSGANAAEASMIPGIEVHAFDHLADLITWGGGTASRPHTHHSHPHASDTPTPGEEAAPPLDLSDVRGQNEAARALEIAAAGGHHIHFIGEPGAGKTMLADRLPTILPTLDDQTALMATAIHSVAGEAPATGLIRQPPLSAPHHSISMAAMIGGGSLIPQPGAVSLAHGGVLLLDETPEFSPSVLDSLRQPLEKGLVHLHRVHGSVTYPAQFQLVMTSNPCPCGNFGARRRQCVCTSLALRRYQARLSGPLRDRIDMTVPLHQPSKAQLRAEAAEDSATVQERVREARERTRRRLQDTPWTLNTQLPGQWIRQHTHLPADVIDSLDTATDKGLLSLRGADRVLRLMWTLADLDGRATPDLADLGEALALRTGGDYCDTTTL